MIPILVLWTGMNAGADQWHSCLSNAIDPSAAGQGPGVGLEQADAELNRVYGQIRAAYRDDPLFLEKLKAAQLAWIALRDADFELQYPHSAEPGYYGSVFPACASCYKTKLTLQRVEFLTQWLAGVEEGEVCRGSRMPKWRLEAIVDAP
jgi:uncharacterized protein YecT (DUF1311 family)